MKRYSYAKLNLGLNIVGKEKNGYHLLDMVMVPIELHDTLTFRLCKEQGIFLSTNDPNLPTNESNTIVKTYQLVKEKFPSVGGLLVDLEKRIPMQAGLGGGSSNAATTLLFLNEAYHLNLSLDQLIILGRTIGSDVPFFLLQSSARVQGTGEILTHIKSKLSRQHVLLIKPKQGLSTKEVYQQVIPPYISKKNQIDHLIQAIEEGSLKEVTQHLFNDLEAPAFRVDSSMETLKKELAKEAPGAVLMSGSGSTFFILNEDEEILKKIRKKLSKVYEFINLTKFN